jgi:hypothetical protein
MESLSIVIMVLNSLIYILDNVTFVRDNIISSRYKVIIAILYTLASLRVEPAAGSL